MAAQSAPKKAPAKKPVPASKPAQCKKPAASNDNKGFAVVSKTTITTLQNSSGVKRVVKETTTAPKKTKKVAAKPAPKKAPAKKPVAKK